MAGLHDTDPRRIGPYEIVERLGSGGMGVVYLGRTAAGERVAVKVVQAELARDEEFRRRFKREAAATARIAGPGIARVVACDPDADPPWLATDFIDGPSLADVVAHGGPLKPGALRDLGAALAWALAEVHAARLVHRDVKPANVLMSADGPRLIDFGIAKDLTASIITRTGSSLGTPRFMAPEQIRADGVIGPAADVFALGGLLVFTATGSYAFGRDDATGEQVRHAILNDEPQLDAVPAGLRGLLARCLDKDPGRRPTPAQVAAALSDTVTVERTRESRRPPARTGRRRTIVIAGAVALSAAGALAAGAIYGFGPGHDPGGGASANSTAGRILNGNPLANDPSIGDGNPAAANGDATTGPAPSPATGQTTTTPSLGSTATSTARTAITTPPAASASGKVPPLMSPPSCGPLPCRTSQDPVIWTVQSGDPFPADCVISTDNPGAGGQQPGVSNACHSINAQFSIDHGSIANTAQLESKTFPGTCMSTPDGYNTSLRTCDSTDAKQWWTLPPSGTEGQIHPYNSSACLIVRMVANSILYVGTCTEQTTYWDRWQLQRWTS